MNLKRIIISRTDSIGDVMLTLPLCAWLKQQFPDVFIIFLGKTYTLPILNAYKAVDLAVDWSEIATLPRKQQIQKFQELKADAIIHVFPNKEIANLAKQAKIPHRIGTSHRIFHLFTCNHRINFTRKNSDKHEAQLNFELLRPLGLKELPEIEELNAFTTLFGPKKCVLPSEIGDFIEKNKTFILLHPKSQGSALEWSLKNFIELNLMLNEQKIGVIYTGTENEGLVFRKKIPVNSLTIDSSGKLSLEELFTLISRAKGIVACSTGPLHIGGFLGIITLGLFSSRHPIHPGRWHPLGKNVHALVHDIHCPKCAKKQPCLCIQQISPQRVLDMLISN